MIKQNSQSKSMRYAQSSQPKPDFDGVFERYQAKSLRDRAINLVQKRIEEAQSMKAKEADAIAIDRARLPVLERIDKDLLANWVEKLGGSED